MTSRLNQQLARLANVVAVSLRPVTLTLAIAAAALANAGNYELETIADNLNRPWSVAFLPSGDFLVTLRGGKLIRLSENGDQVTPIDNTPDTRVASQGGYFDVLLDRNFTDSNRLFLSFAESDNAGNGTSVISAVLKNDKLTNITKVFISKDRISTSVHYGGRMVQLPDGRLLLTTGDGFNYREASQDINNHLGKVIELTPTQSGDTYAASIYAYGFRNPQGLFYDEKEDAIYLHEHGPKGGDELNIVQQDKNYGWPATSYGVNYSGARVSPYKSLPGIEEPIKYWTPSIAPSGLTRYEGNLFPEWENSFFIGTLVFRDVRRVTLTDQGPEEEIMFDSIGERIRDIRTAPDGHIYLLTDGNQGKLIKVKPAL